MDVLYDEVNLARLFEQLEDLVESVSSYLGITLSVLLIATRKDLADEVDTRRVLLLYLYAKFLEIVRDRVFFQQQRGRFRKEVQDSFIFVEISKFSFGLFGGGRVETLQFNLSNFHLRFSVHKRPRPLLDFLLLLADLALDLLLPFLDEPFNQPSVVLLRVDHVLLLGQHRPRPKLLLLGIDNPVQFPILGSVARSGFFVKRLLRSREGACQTSIGVQFLPSEKLVQSEEKGLGALGAEIDDRFVFLLGDFELLAREV